ncbi:hypothetical protein OSTOST_13742 [Ostertagia ostertagi]
MPADFLVGSDLHPAPGNSASSFVRYDYEFVITTYWGEGDGPDVDFLLMVYSEQTSNLQRESGSSMQKEVVSVLAAVAELIKERNGSETDVEYFAALITTLEGSPINEPSRTAAVAFLLQLIVKKVPKEVLQSQFTKVVQVLYTKMLENSESNEGSALKYLLSVLGVVLRAQPAGVWNVANTKNMVVSVAALSAHEKPWVRTMARRVVRAVLTDPITAMENGLHAASSSVGMFIQQQLQSALGKLVEYVSSLFSRNLLEGNNQA